MGIAGGLLLVTIGAVLAFAVRVDLGALNIQAVGWIMLIAGLFSMGVSLWRMNSPRRREVTIRHTPGSPVQTVIEEERVETARDETPPV